MPDVIEQAQVQREEPRDRDPIFEAWRALLRAIGDFLSRRFDSARPWVDRAESRLSGLEQKAAQEGRKAAAATDAYVRAKPWQALGIAAGVAFIVGTLLRRR